MAVLLFRLKLILWVLLVTFSWAKAQDIWDIPWLTIGDPDGEYGEEVILTGVITDEAGEPISGASISVETFRYFDYSDKAGRYYLDLPPGKYKVTVRHVGYKQIYLRLDIVSNGMLNLKMQEGSFSLDEVVISAKALDSNVKDPIAGMATLNVEDIRTLPTLMGEVDVIKSLQLMPGVSSVGEGSSGFNVRGGRTDQNLVLLNGVPVFSTSHALGFVTSFNQDIVNDFSLYKGNVPAQYGGRVSSVLEVNSKSGNTDNWTYQGGVGMISSRFTAEGPIKKETTSLLVGGRLSYADWFLSKVNEPDVKNSSTTFYDMYASLQHKFSKTSVIDAFYYASQDKFRFSDEFGYRWNNQVASAKWQALTDSKASPSVLLAYGHFKSSLIDPAGIDASQLDQTLNYIQLKPSVNYIPNEKHNITAGLEGLAYLPRPEVRKPGKDNTALPSKSVEKNRGLELSAYINDDFTLSEKISIAAGVRFSHYSHIGPDTVFKYAPNAPKTPSTIVDTLYYKNFERIKNYSGIEPRVSIRLSVGKDQSIKVGYNRMFQYIHQISNTTAPTPIDFWQVSNEYLPPQMADNYSIGYFLNLKDNRWETSVEFFYKKMKNLVEYKDFPELFLNNHLETELLSGNGRAYGAELFIRRLKGKWTGWLSYTYSQTEVQVSSDFSSESINNGAWYPSGYNKPHIFNLVLNRWLYKRGAFSLVASYNTGRPLTGIETSYIVDDIVVPVYSDRNKYKIPDYFRVDVSITIGNVFRKIDDSLIFSVYNLFGRDNAYSVFYKRPKSTYFIPGAYQLSVLGAVLPSLTYNFKF